MSYAVALIPIAFCAWWVVEWVLTCLESERLASNQERKPE